MICMAIPSPFLREEKHLQGEADCHGKAGREIKLIARLNDVTKRRANKLADLKPSFFMGGKGAEAATSKLRANWDVLQRVMLFSFSRRKSGW